jgi:acyl-CoA synthetase (AMP-forming)/AMP-acid ligase II
MMAASILAVIKAGCIAVPTMPLLRARELGVIADKAEVNAVLCADSLRAELEAAPGPAAANKKILWFGERCRPPEARGADGAPAAAFERWIPPPTTSA